MKQGGFLPEDLAGADLPSAAANLVVILKAIGFLAYVVDDECVGIVGHQIDTDEERRVCAQRWSGLWDTEHLFLEPASTLGCWRWHHLGCSTTQDESRTVGRLFEALLTAMGRPQQWLTRWEAACSDYVERVRAALGGGVS